jgi:anti-sigma regulatory factor (Ser/Thr protein kinase)
VCCEPVLTDPTALTAALRAQPHRSVHHDYPPAPQAVPEARRFVTDATRGLLDDDDLHAAALLASELVTNAVLHARTPLQVGVTSWPDHILIAVGDHDPAPPLTRSEDVHRPNGRGIPLIDALATRWGYTAYNDGKTTWLLIHR